MTDVSPSSLRRSQGHIVVARGLWYVKPGRCELRNERLSSVRPGEARVQTLYSGISRGTERLVANGEVPESEWAHMRAPLQAGAFPFPVKYGYSATGTVTAGPDTLLGRNVFCLHPHQDYFQVAEDMLIPIPDGIPARRATLAANMETALNAHWDSGTGPSDKIAVVGAGIVGLLVAALAAKIAGTRVTITDIDPNCAAVAEALGVSFAEPRELGSGYDIVFHTSASSAGLETAVEAAGFEGRIVEMSWYGTKPVTIHLGGGFHSRRLTLISSQVGHVAPRKRATMSHRQRLTAALEHLADPRFDALVSSDVAFENLPDNLSGILSAAGLPPVIRYTNLT